MMKEIIYVAKCQCPICQKEILKKMIKAGKNKLVGTDFDLNAHYENVNPLFYEVNVCEACGYAQLHKREDVSPYEICLLKDNICSKFGGRTYNQYYTAEEAIDRHKLAILNAIARNATEGEKGYLALKLAWLYREINDEEQEKRFLRETVTCFVSAYERETFPIFELEEETVLYLIATLNYEIDEWDEAHKWLGVLLRNKDLSPKLRDRIFDLKEKLKENKSA